MCVLLILKLLTIFIIINDEAINQNVFFEIDLLLSLKSLLSNQIMFVLLS